MDLQIPVNGLVGSTRAAFALFGLEQDAGAGQHAFGGLAAPNPGSQSRSPSANYTADLVLRMRRHLGAAEIWFADRLPLAPPRTSVVTKHSVVHDGDAGDRRPFATT
jgi:hypothetical protein